MENLLCVYSRLSKQSKMREIKNAVISIDRRVVCVSLWGQLKRSPASQDPLDLMINRTLNSGQLKTTNIMTARLGTFCSAAPAFSGPQRKICENIFGSIGGRPSRPSDFHHFSPRWCEETIKNVANCSIWKNHSLALINLSSGFPSSLNCKKRIRFNRNKSIKIFFLDEKIRKVKTLCCYWRTLCFVVRSDRCWCFQGGSVYIFQRRLKRSRRGVIRMLAILFSSLLFKSENIATLILETWDSH